MDKEVRIFFKIEGIDTEITDLNQLNKALSKTADETEKVGEATKKSESKIDKFGNKLSSMPGPLGAVGKGVKALNTAFKALLANPILLAITAIVGAITALGKAFFSTKEGGEALDRFMAGFSAVMDVFRDVLVDIGGKLMSIFKDPKQALIDFGTAIKENIINRFEGILEFIPAVGTAVKQLFERDFEGAAKTAADAVLKVTTGVENATDKMAAAGSAVKGVMDEAAQEAARAAELTGILQKLTDQERELNVERANQNALIAEAKLKVDDETLSIEERQAALKQASEAEQALLDETLRIEEERLAAMQELADMSDSDQETLDALADQEIKLASLREQSTNKQIQLSRRMQSLDNEAAADKKANDEAQAARDKEAADKKAEQAAADQAARDAQLKAEADLKRELLLLNETDSEREKRIIEETYAARLKAAGDNVELIKQVEAQYQADKQALAQSEIDAEIAKQQSIQEIVNGYIEKEYENQYKKAQDQLLMEEEAAIKRLEQEGATAEQIQRVREEFANKNKKLMEDEAEYKKKLDQQELNAKLDVLESSFNAIANIVGEQSAVGKAAAVASATINTYQAATNALANTPAPPPFPQIAAGVAIASGLLNVKKILQTKTPGNQGGSGGGGSLPSASAASMTPNLSYNFNQAGGPTIGLGQNSIGQGPQNEPVKAYVLVNDVNNAQQANSQIENLSKL